MPAHLEVSLPHTRRRMSGAILWHALTLATLASVAGVVAWDEWRPWVNAPQPGFGALLALTAVAYVTSVAMSFRLSRYPLAQPGALAAVNVTFAFALLVVFLLFTRWYYSRSFLITSYLVALTWQTFGHLLYPRQTLKLAIVPGGELPDLSAAPRVQCRVLSEARLDGGVDALVVDLNADLETEWRRLITLSSAKGLPVYDPPGIRETLTGRLTLEEAREDLPATLARIRVYSHLKRFADLAGTLFLAPLVILVSLIVALFVALDSRGPVLFVQERVGVGGRTFRLLKFRSMRVDADANGSQFAGENDDRITRVGGFLRKFRLDELPQFWNVLKGDMSLVGPRPEQVPFVQQFERDIPMYSYRHLVRPGITGWAQVAQGYAADTDETRVKLEHDLYYVKHLSAWLDLHVLIKSVGVVLSGSGAR